MEVKKKMGLADELLEDLSSDIIEREENDHIVIGADRFMVIPEALKKIAVQYDHNIETITFDCPRYWDNHDMSKMRIYVNYIRSDDEQGCDLATNIIVDEKYDNIMHFDWTITGHLTATSGPVTILVCIQKVGEDGTEENHWNSELNTETYVSRGMECEGEVIDHYPGIITSLLARMDYVEEIATPETMQNYVNDYLDKNPDTPETIKNYLYSYMANNYSTSEELMAEYVSMYMDTHPLLFAIGSQKPVVGSLWFNTGGSTSEEVATVKITGNNENDAAYIELETGEIVSGYNFDIL